MDPKDLAHIGADLQRNGMKRKSKKKGNEDIEEKNEKGVNLERSNKLSMRSNVQRKDVKLWKNVKNSNKLVKRNRQGNNSNY